MPRRATEPDRGAARESAVLTLFACAGARRASRPTAVAGAALALSLVACANVSPALADGIEIDTCVGSGHAGNCAAIWAPLGDPYVRKVPQPRDAADRARAAEEDRRWVERCHPTIRPDGYGVARYHYTRPGCDFGVGSY